MSIFVVSQQGKANEVIQIISAVKEQGKAVDQFLNSLDSNGKSALHYASESGKLDVVKILLQHGSNPNLPNRATQSTPLHMAAFYGHASIIDELVKIGGNVNVFNANRITPLHSASDNGHVSAVEALLRNGAKHDQARDKKGATPLHYAVAQGHSKVIEALCSSGKVNINIEDDLKQTPLIWAAKTGKLESVGKILVTYGADMSAIDKNGISLTMDAKFRRTLMGFMKGDDKPSHNASTSSSTNWMNPATFTPPPSTPNTGATSTPISPSTSNHQIPSTPNVNSQQDISSLFPTPPKAQPPPTFAPTKRAATMTTPMSTSPQNVAQNVPQNVPQSPQFTPEQIAEFSELFGHKHQKLGTILPVYPKTSISPSSSAQSTNIPTQPNFSSPIRSESSETSSPVVTTVSSKKINLSSSVSKETSPENSKKKETKDNVMKRLSVFVKSLGSNKEEGQEPEEPNFPLPPTSEEALSIEYRPKVGRPLKEGHVWLKIGKVKKNWKLFWFVLEEKQLSYFEHPQSPKPIKSVPMETGVFAVERSKHSSSLNFAIKTPQKKKYVCEAESTDEKHSWMAFINRVVYERTTASASATLNQVPKEPNFQSEKSPEVKVAAPATSTTTVETSKVPDFPDIPSRPDFSEFAPKKTNPIQTITSAEIAVDDVDSSDEDDEKVDLAVDLAELDKIEKQLDLPSGKTLKEFDDVTKKYSGQLDDIMRAFNKDL